MILELCKGVHCVDLDESFQTHIYLQNLASIQPRTSPLKFVGSRDSWSRSRPPCPGVGTWGVKDLRELRRRASAEPGAVQQARGEVHEEARADEGTKGRLVVRDVHRARAPGS